MTGRLRICIATSLAAMALAVLWQALRDGEPTYQGKSVSVWYESLCTGVFGGTPRSANFQAAYNAFSHMGPEMVPFLTHKLRYDRKGTRERVIKAGKNIPLLKNLANRVIWPTERRCYAAVALRCMGPRAQPAIPGLLEACVKDSAAVRLNAVAALGAILNYQIPEGLNPGNLITVENAIISKAAHECPEAAARLGIPLYSNK